ncbi:MAG TPA: hypothetical protein VMK12_24080 [Anaeromyxobacteraceae bacterium]|nr:hypothetical protein [Anaeromyxobacteraceae bacterium]
MAPLPHRRNWHERPAAHEETAGWSAKELLDELLARPVRIAAFDFLFCIPGAFLRDEKFAADAGYKGGAFRS